MPVECRANFPFDAFFRENLADEDFGRLESSSRPLQTQFGLKIEL